MENSSPHKEYHNKYDHKIVAITVTYNRIHTLKRTINALLNQTYPVYKIIVVDNSSNLKEKEFVNDLVLSSQNIDVVWLSENLGGAGGFEIGMAKARNDYQPDWYWIMDDDAYPRSSCLEILLSYEKSLECIGCLVPAIFGIDNNEFQMYHHKKVTKYTFCDIKIKNSYTDLEDITKIDANAFVGPLFSRKAIDSEGLVDGSLFIYGDDTEYTFRVSRKYNIYLIKQAIIEHQDPPILNKAILPNSWWKQYYEIRNKFLFIRKFQSSVTKRIFAQGCLSLFVCKSIIASILKGKYKGYKFIRINLLLKALKDGLIGKKGKTIDPVKYLQMVNRQNITKK